MFDAKWEEAVKHFDETPLLGLVLAEEKLLHGRVLELGCGTGKFTAQLALKADHVTAVDNSQAVLQVAQEKVYTSNLAHKIAFLCMDLEKGIPLRQGFTFVLAAFCLHHIESYQRVIQDSSTVLLPGGTMVVLEPYPGGTMFELKRDCYSMDSDAIADEYKYRLYVQELNCVFSQVDTQVLRLEWVFPTVKSAVDSIFYVAFETEGELEREEEFIREFLRKNLEKSKRGIVATQDYMFIAARK